MLEHIVSGKKVAKASSYLDPCVYDFVLQANWRKPGAKNRFVRAVIDGTYYTYISAFMYTYAYESYFLGSFSE